LALAVILGIAQFRAQAQTGDSARIYGSVHDSSGAAVANAEVIAKNQNTGVIRKTVSTDSGDFVIANLPTGTYTVTITLSGFKAYLQEGIQLHVDAQAQVSAMLVVGELKESVSVTAEAPLLESRVATLNNVVGEKDMTELPLNGRNALQLTLLVPGVEDATNGTFISGNSRPDQQLISTGGARGNTVLYNLDGIFDGDSYTNITNVYPNPDALQEFSFQTNDFSAEYGHRVGGVVNAITRSGSNGFHGSLFEFVRNDFFDATNFFTPGVSDGLQRNQYGATLGGPIRRNKTFFFGSWQATGLRQHAVGATDVVPTAAERLGDFSHLLNSSGQEIIIKDPTTGQPFANNQISPTRFDPVAAQVLQWIPIPTNSTGVLQVPVYTIYNDNQFVGKVDHNLSDSTRLSVRYLYDMDIAGNTVLPTDLLGANREPDFRSHNALLSVLHTFSPTLIFVASTGFNRLQSSYTRGFPETLAQLGANIGDLSVNKDVELSIGNFFTIPPITGLNGGILTRNDFQNQASFTWIKGKHELKFGADVLRLHLDMPSLPFNSDGKFTFTNSFTGSNLTDFLLGQGTSFTQGSPQSEALRGWSPGFYIQDNYRITSKLTLNLGLRYEPFFPWIDVRADKIAVWRPGQQSTRAPGLPPNLLVGGDPGVPQAGYNGSLNRFEPRLGFAYQLDSKTATRGGFGIFYDYPNSQVANEMTLYAPFAVKVTIQNPTSIVNPWTAAQPNPFPTVIPPPPSYAFPKPLTSAVYAPNFTNAHAEQWNFTVERQLLASWVARVSYMATQGGDLLANRSSVRL
jgi:hypothetical protein